jgi:hypothetical protein
MVTFLDGCAVHFFWLHCKHSLISPHGTLDSDIGNIATRLDCTVLVIRVFPDNILFRAFSVFLGHLLSEVGGPLLSFAMHYSAKNATRKIEAALTD